MRNKPLAYMQIDRVVDAFMSNGELDKIEALYPQTSHSSKTETKTSQPQFPSHSFPDSYVADIARALISQGRLGKPLRGLVTTEIAQSAYNRTQKSQLGFTQLNFEILER